MAFTAHTPSVGSLHDADVGSAQAPRGLPDPLPGLIDRKAHRSLRALAAGLLLAGTFALPARAGEDYVIPSSEGYGIGECMHAGTDCGRVIADSWCESHGHAHVLAYGTVDDVTGAIPASTKAADAPKGEPGDVVIRCGD